jgi:hypothetical protein
VLQRGDLDAETILLYEFLVDQQTSADGLVFYGRPVGYAWIQSRYRRGSLRSLERRMRQLKDAAFVDVSRAFHGGVRIRLLQSVKFRKPLPPPAVQLSLYSPQPTAIGGGKPVRNSVEKMSKPVEKPCKSSESPADDTATVGGIEPPRLAVERSRKQVNETIGLLAEVTGLPFAVEKTPAQLTARRRFLQRQAAIVIEKFKSSDSETSKTGTA